MSKRRSLKLRPWMIVTAMCFLYVTAILIQNNGDPLALVTIGTRFSQSVPQGTEGYDGQFVYYIARDPSTAATFLDVPAYRFQRILLPMLGRVLNLGQETLIPWALLFINLSAMAIGTWFLEKLLEQHGVSRWYALTYGLTIGIFGSVRLSLSEPLAYGLVLAGIWLATRQRWILGAVIFALAILAKETTLFFVVGYGLYLLSKRQFYKAVIFGAISITPFVIWQAVLYNAFGQFGVGSGGALATSFEIVPFAGVIRILTETPLQIRATLIVVFGVILIPFVLVPTLWALWRCWKDWRERGCTAYTYLMFVNAAIMPFVPFSTYREPIGILRFIVGLQIALILYAAEHRHKKVLRYSTFWIVTLLFVFSLIAAE